MNVTTNKKKIVLDMDDYSVSCPNFELLMKLKEHFPSFKVTLFTIPLDMMLLSDKIKMPQFLSWVEMLKEYQDWVEIAVHGFIHDKKEMLVDYKRAKLTLKASENMMTQIKKKEKVRFIGSRNKKYKFDIPYKKIFKAPGWQMSDDAYKAARDMGYVVAIDRNKPSPEIENLKTYKYNWSIEEPFPEDFRIIKGHGHMYGMQNDLQACYQNLLTLPTDAEFLFISEYLKLYG